MSRPVASGSPTCMTITLDVPYALRKAPFQTALEIQFRGVENLIRALDGLTWTRGRRRR